MLVATKGARTERKEIVIKNHNFSEWRDGLVGELRKEMRQGRMKSFSKI